MCKMRFPAELDAVVLECVDVKKLSDFYLRLLGWEKCPGADDEWVEISPASGAVKLAFQQNAAYIPPVWPDEAGRQQQMMHLDFTVATQAQLEAAVSHALICGARKAAVQYEPEEWITLIDPAGHPFCFVIKKTQ